MSELGANQPIKYKVKIYVYATMEVLVKPNEDLEEIVREKVTAKGSKALTFPDQLEWSRDYGVDDTEQII